ncbi:FGGY-family carbohydrate kinase [Rhodobacter sp. Har01]|uniref:FGGY-family carbohydrate kinase n=1 Tax=Rhodobacter sp. Har01 TaxID=2883999 RepID=UPI001D090545|nr:FGGY-family carbohydrate kinase [Rhodobacter sp. Har01]MCB6180063.1 FGGY-family carbohydrate kinase [Rhodobacter sp. Har01]
MRHIAVIDIGKTNAKVLRVDLATGSETVTARRPNAVLAGGPYPHFDLPALWSFVREGLRDLGRDGPVDAISITTHGAAAALVAGDGDLALPVLDYEHDGPDALAGAYDALRPAFPETGSPRLPLGLNLGSQLYWLSERFPDGFARARHILTLPQYWAFRLTGVAASEATSLGCHTDLWAPWTGEFSSLVDRMGWRGLFPPLRPAATRLGPILPDIATATGLPTDTPVLCGIHDSNASLLPYLGREGALSVLSTGTWMIAMALGGVTAPLDPTRDVLVNVNAKGQPTPTARAMAGREFDEVTKGRMVTPTPQEERAVLGRPTLALPSHHPDTGPFPGQDFAWVPGEPETDGERTAAASFQAALTGAECLRLIGAAGPTYVEGPFGANRAFARMLATATGRPVIATGQGAGTGLGAALLAGPLHSARPDPAPVLPEADPLWRAYAARWRAEVAARQAM